MEIHACQYCGTREGARLLSIVIAADGLVVDATTSFIWRIRATSGLPYRTMEIMECKVFFNEHFVLCVFSNTGYSRETLTADPCTPSSSIRPSPNVWGRRFVLPPLQLPTKAFIVGCAFAACFQAPLFLRRFLLCIGIIAFLAMLMALLILALR